ncbi:hypothetical protein [Aeropyrum camini]|uniref:hypothetical protein n=1 Tax=Aeropyrum camini TaxID=229980 RepID=UPI00138F2BE1|nr:hypothetical protein [Aeropyrum camini]
MLRRRSSGRRRCFKPSSFIAVLAEKPKAAAKIAYALSDGRAPLRCSEYGVSYWLVRRDGATIVVAPSAGHLFGPHSEYRGFPVFHFQCARFSSSTGEQGILPGSTACSPGSSLEPFST